MTEYYSQILLPIKLKPEKFVKIGLRFAGKNISPSEIDLGKLICDEKIPSCLGEYLSQIKIKLEKKGFHNINGLFHNSKALLLLREGLLLQNS